MNRVVLFYKRLVGPGGGERQFVEDYKYLRSRSIDVRVLTFECNRDALFGSGLSSVEVLVGHGMVSQLRALRRRLKELAPDVVVVHSGHIDVYLATRGLGIPYAFYHNDPILLYFRSEPHIAYSLLFRGRFRRLLEVNPHARQYFDKLPRLPLQRRVSYELRCIVNARAIRAAKRIFVLSRLVAQEVGLTYRASAVSIRGAFHPSIFSYSPKTDVRRVLGLDGCKIVLSVSRLSFEKRLDVLIRAFDQAAAAMPCIVLVLGGTGPDRQALESLVSTLPHRDRIFFVGYIAEEKLLDYYAACDVFASPAWADFDIAPYEALALGKKVVWSSEMEMDDWLAESGLVFSAPPTVGGFQRALAAALNAPHRSAPDLTPYTWERKFDEVYRLLGMKASGS